MRTCACMWGGSFNPIIPVFKKPPTEWRPEKFERVKGLSVARGYVRLFEPDIYVEAEQGLLEEVGLGAFRQEHTMDPLAFGLKDLLAIEKGHRDWAELAVGLNVIDILQHFYDTEQRFQPRDKRSSIIVKPERGDAAAEAIFGVYPTRKDAAHIPEWYRNVFKPSELKSSAEAWIEIYTNGAMTPLRVSRHGLDLRRYWYHDLVVYVFDPAKATDLIDLWNLRLEPSPVLPVPVGWFDALRDHLGHAIKDTHRVIRGNPSGLMHHATVEFARSIARADAERMAEALSGMVPKGAFGAKHWRTRIWDMPDDDRVHRDGRLRVKAAERSQRLTVRDDGEARASFDTLSPEFASRYGGALRLRWINTVGVSLYGDKHYATVLPFNTFDRRWPRLAMGCPAGELLICRYTREQDGKNLRYYWISACSKCPLKSQCTTGPERRVALWEHEHVVEAVQRRLDANPEKMRVRREKVEHPFATLKERMGTTHFLTKTLPKVAIEMALSVLAY